MNKDAMLKTLAETGYNVGFGAKKHFATFDIVDKVPSGLGFIGLAVGILGLVFDELAAKLPSAILAISGVAAVYISLYGHRKDEYESSGIELTRVFNELRRIYREVQGGGSVSRAQAELQALENTFTLNLCQTELCSATGTRTISSLLRCRSTGYQSSENLHGVTNFR